MKEISNFNVALQTFVLEEAKKEADAVLSEKDAPTAQFNLENIRKFSYKSELDRFQKTNPLLLGKPSHREKNIILLESDTTRCELM